MSLIVSSNAFRLQSGELKEFLTTAGSGREKVCAFCPDCGVRIFNATSALMAIKAGTLDDKSWLEPDAHYWTKRKHSWISLPKDIPFFNESE